MSRWINPPGATSWKEILQRYVKVGGVWKPVQERDKRLGTTQQEVWPLQPGPVNSLSLAQTYQNDDIEAVTTWTAPTTGATTVDYRVIYSISGQTPVEFIVAAGTLTHTYNNGGNGIQGWAGQTITVQVIPRSAGPRDGTGTTTAAQTVITLPPPPNVGSLTISMSSYAMTMTWPAVTGNRISSYLLNFYQDGTFKQAVTVAKTATSYAGQPWDPNTVSGGSVDVYIKAQGQGGSSPAWTHDGGTLPTMPTLSTGAPCRFYNGQLIQDVNCPGAGCNTYWQNVSAGGAWNFFQVSGVGRVVLGGSEGWARDDATYYRFIYVPFTGRGWTGRAVGSNWALKMPNPYTIQPTWSETWYSERGWFGLPIKQGQSSAGDRTGCYFYGGRILSAFTPNRTGYDFTVTSAEMLFGRTANGGLGQAVPIRLWMHGFNDRPGGRPDLAGGVDFASVARNTGGIYALPGGWGDQLKAGWYAGTAIYYPPTGLNASIGNVSNQYVEAYGTDTSAFGMLYGTIRFYHDA